MRLLREEPFLLFGLKPDAYAWKGLLWFVGVYFGAFVAGAVIGTPIYLLFQQLGAGRPEEELLGYLAHKQIDDYVDRVRLLATAVAVFWLIRRLGLFGQFGFHWREGGWKRLHRWFIIGVASLVPVLLLQLAFLDFNWIGGSDPVGWAGVLITSLLGGLALGFLEEAIFRGMLLRIFYTAMRPWPAIVLSSLFFAFVHFKKVHIDPDAAFHWWTGFEVAARSAFSIFYTFDFYLFTNLFLVGVVLCLVFLRTRSLVACMGLHAGWVFVRNTWLDFVEVDASPATFWLGTAGVTDGVIPVLVLVLVGAGVYFSYLHHVRPAAAEYR